MGTNDSKSLIQVSLDWVLPYFNRRAEFLYSQQLEIVQGVYTDQDGVKYTPQFFQGLIEVPFGKEVDFKPYVKKVAQFYNKNLKENNFDHGLMCPIFIVKLDGINAQRYIVGLYLYPSSRILDFAKGDLSYENMVPIMNREVGLETGFYKSGELPTNDQEWWEDLI